VDKTVGEYKKGRNGVADGQVSFLGDVEHISLGDDEETVEDENYVRYGRGEESDPGWDGDHVEHVELVGVGVGLVDREWVDPATGKQTDD